MSETLFSIKGLRCAYSNDHEVLRIDDITIPSKKLMILLGKSGSGKSTFLETLGLMNNTITQGDVSYYPDNGSDKISYSNIWSQKKLKEVAKIRHDHFSFIFQNTNLMPNFSAYENACLTELIRGTSMKNASGKVTELMKELGLAEISQTRKASELSGGQKQRIAFIRAVASDFNVLFGDEPTGNLDDFNSRELINFIKNNIHTYNRSAIIVSHNVSLSMEFGDIIMVLNESDKSLGYCELTKDHVFERDINNNVWKNHTDKYYTDLELSEKIKDILGTINNSK
jgi:ABC-type lipoprotein export system ATPase subunit